ncbi:MAG TPA: DUF4058 family protein [Gemmataceae bacterium]|nr:DUF4058 family protein [Gemmataceae bacterium]
MPSPFPGMDPYLEAPDIWPDLHDRLATRLSDVLNETLPAPYYARLEMRPEVGIAEEEGGRRIVPDVAVVRHPRPSPTAGGVAVLEAPRAAVSPFVEVEVIDERARHAYVEIRDPSRGHHLITLIEIVSPNCKRPGDDREAYFRKQREVLDSDASLIEIDLLRAGQRPLADARIEVGILGLRPAPDYLVQIHRAWKRSSVQLFHTRVIESLPVFLIPLREGQPEVLLDLQFVFNRAYDGGPYRRGAVDYTQPPRPPLPVDLEEWGRERVRAAGFTAG